MYRRPGLPDSPQSAPQSNACETVQIPMPSSPAKALYRPVQKERTAYQQIGRNRYIIESLEFQTKSPFLYTGELLGLRLQGGRVRLVRP